MTSEEFKGKKRKDIKQITAYLRNLGDEAHDWTEADGTITKSEALARLLWKKALGWTEINRDDEGKEKKTEHKPEAWAINLIYERLEGRSPLVHNEDETKITTLDKVRDIGKNRANAIALASVNLEKTDE